LSRRGAGHSKKDGSDEGPHGSASASVPRTCFSSTRASALGADSNE
jgi:hypothetical protein